VRQLTGVIAGLAFAISVWACLPFSRSYIASPPIAGVYRAETGEPLGGVQLAIATADGDSLCSSPALQTTTDSAGAFYLPATVKHVAVTVLAPGDQVYGFTMCARVAGTLRLAFEAHTEVNRSISPTPISLTCIESRTPNTAPVVCTKER
jgi:hypothetical protein